MKVLVPSTIRLDPPEGGASFVRYDVGLPLPPEHHDADVLIAWQNPPEGLLDAARNLHSLRLVQALASGADAVLAAGFAPEVAICSGRSLHDGPVAEHALALVLAAVRRLDVLARSQASRTWDEKYISAQSDPATADRYTLEGARVLIWGFGSIASRLAPLLSQLGAHVTGVGRAEGERGGYRIITRDQAQSALASTDVLISLAPATAETVNLFDAQVFGSLKAGAVFVNVGRGATVDEDALLDALDSGRLRVAALDVMKAEPLPADSPLWVAPNLVLTPHVAGNRPRGADALVARNLSALESGAPLENEVRPGAPRPA